LQIAVVSLFAFVVALAVGTMMESWYSAQVAQQLVYRAWWFTLLLAVLAVNIFFAAVKKWPWKKHQTGFLITHVGLIMMLAGGILNAVFGTDAALPLADVDNSNVNAEYGPQTDNHIVDREEAVLTVRHATKHGGAEEKVSFPFNPGSFKWHADENSPESGDALLGFLEWLSQPLGYGFEQEISEFKDLRVTLRVLNSYPHVRREPFTPTDEREGEPALKVSVSSTRF